MCFYVVVACPDESTPLKTRTGSGALRSSYGVCVVSFPPNGCPRIYFGFESEESTNECFRRQTSRSARGGASRKHLRAQRWPSGDELVIFQQHRVGCRGHTPDDEEKKSNKCRTKYKRRNDRGASIIGSHGWRGDDVRIACVRRSAPNVSTSEIGACRFWKPVLRCVCVAKRDRTPTRSVVEKKKEQKESRIRGGKRYGHKEKKKLAFRDEQRCRPTPRRDPPLEQLSKHGRLLRRPRRDAPGRTSDCTR